MTSITCSREFNSWLMNEGKPPNRKPTKCGRGDFTSTASSISSPADRRQILKPAPFGPMKRPSSANQELTKTKDEFAKRPTFSLEAINQELAKGGVAVGKEITP